MQQPEQSAAISVLHNLLDRYGPSYLSNIFDLAGYFQRARKPFRT